MIEITFNSIILLLDANGNWWLRQFDGEGMVVNKAEIEHILQEYYKENF